MNWDHKDVWTMRSDLFTVTVERRTVDHDDRRGPHRWNVYAYIYSGHPHFVRFNGTALDQPACQEMPFHGGVTLVKYHRGEDTISSIQVGGDYNHEGDERFTRHATSEKAVEQFGDAEELFNWLLEQETTKN